MKAINQTESLDCTIVQMAGSFKLLMEDWTRERNTEKKNRKQSTRYKLNKNE